MKDSLWNRNFKIMFLGTVLSALGGIGLNAALSVVVFDYTQSTFLMSLFISVVSLPHLIFPLFIGVFVDRHDPLKTLLKNESILIVFYICFLIVYLSIGFRYVFFLLITCCISLFGVVSDLANQSISAQLMSKNTMSRGYAILSTIYPLCNVIVVPLALFVYKKYGLEILMVVYIVLSTLDLLIESRIDAKFEFNQNNSSCSVKDDFKSGFKYLHTKKPIGIVFIFFTIVIMTGSFSSLIYPYFEQSKDLSLENYALLMSVNSLGYMFGGFFHYFVEIPQKYRYTAAVCIYFLFIILDGSLLFMPFTFMVLSKFVLGLAGMNSANIRNTAVQASTDSKYRGKVNGIFSMMMGFASVVGNLIFGFLAEIIDIRTLIVFAQLIYCLAVISLILPRNNHVRELYNLNLTCDDENVINEI